MSFTFSVVLSLVLISLYRHGSKNDEKWKELHCKCYSRSSAAGSHWWEDIQKYIIPCSRLWPEYIFNAQNASSFFADLSHLPHSWCNWRSFLIVERANMTAFQSIHRLLYGLKLIAFAKLHTALCQKAAHCPKPSTQAQVWHSSAQMVCPPKQPRTRSHSEILVSHELRTIKML